MEKVHFFFKKYYIRFLSALLVFAIFLPRCVVNASAEDDVIVQLYPSWTTYGYADFGCCSFGYTPSSYMKSVPMNINLTGGQQYFPEFIQTSSPYISSYLSGKTVYLCWFFRTTGNIIDRSNISVLVQSTTTSTGGFNNGVSTVSHTLLGGQASSQYHKAGYNESYCTYIRFT